MYRPSAPRRPSRRALFESHGPALLLAAALLISPSSSLAATLWVDAAAASATPGTGCGAAAAYTQICAAPGPGVGTPCAAGSALADANPGDTIEVCAGTYNENVEIATSNVTLRGAKAGVPAGPDAVPAGRGTGESIIVGQTTSAIHLAVGGLTGVVIDGFTIQSGNFPGIHDNPNSASTSHVWANNVIEAGAGCGSAIGAINLNRFSDTQILNNHLTGCGWGIQNQSGVGTSLPSLIEGNYFGGASNSIILGTGHAAGNVIRGNRFERTGSGIIAGCPGLFITDNTFEVGGSAIYFHSKATDATITGNEMLGGSNGFRQRLDFGPYTLGPTNEAHYNNIVGNSNFGVENQVTPGDQDIDATCNWWGAADGPSPTGSGDPVSPGVDFTPWLIAPAPAGACIGGLPCTIDDDCSDGVVCNGVETCDAGTCQLGTPLVCDGPCQTGVCEEPTGCQPVPDGPELCDSGLDMCSVGDSCEAGACVNDGGGGDTDADGTCDLDDPTLPLNVTKIVVRRSPPDSAPRGNLRIIGDFNVLPAEELTEADLYEVEFMESLGTTITMTWAAADCSVRKNGSVACASADKRERVRFKKVGKTPGVYKFIVKGAKLDIPSTTLLEGPVTVRVTLDTVDRAGTIEDCRAKGFGMRCKE